MDWTDDAVILSLRRHGEGALILDLLTETHGRHSGLMRGAGKEGKGALQPGNLVRAQWSARLAEHLGHLRIELLQAHAARLLDDPDRLAALSAACAMSEALLPEREPSPQVYAGLRHLLEALPGESWAAEYVGWELLLLAELGYGLDLTACAAGGPVEQLAFVSPRTGRAVSRPMGEPYRDRLLPLPGFLIGRGVADAPALRQGLDLTGYFIERHVLSPLGRAMPPARTRLLDRIKA